MFGLNVLEVWFCNFSHVICCANFMLSEVLTKTAGRGRTQYKKCERYDAIHNV